MFIRRGRARWSLWAKVGAVGNAQALSTASPPVRREPHRPQIHGAAAPRKNMAGIGLLRVRAQPVAPLSLQLVPKQLGVRALAFVAKPEQLPERTSHIARMGYDERYS